MKKKLLITGSTFPRYENDTEPRFVLDLAKSLSQYADVTVLVPAAQGAKSHEVLEGVSVIRYHYFPVHKLETLCYPGAIVPRIKEKKVRALLVPWLFLALLGQLFRKRKQYDLVLANWLIPQGIVQSFVSTPYYVVGHGGDVTSLNKGIVRKLKARCIRNAKGVFAVSKPLMNTICSVEQPKCCEVISMGCDTTRFGKQFRQDNYFNQGNRRVILFVGRLAEKKGVTYLIEAMQYVKNTALVIVGDGPLKQELVQQAEQMKTQLSQQESDSTITFLGPKTHEELRSIYASADVFAMPSVTARDGDKEGFGLVMLEAFASGLPVVASDSGGISDLVTDGENGFLVPEKDSRKLAERLNCLLENRELYDQMSQKAQITARYYDYSQIGRKYAEFMGLFR